MGMLLVGSTQNLTFVWPGGAHQPFIVHTGDHVLKLSVAIFSPHLRIKWLKAGGQNDRPYIDFYLLRRLIEIDGLILTDSFANTTFLLCEVQKQLYMRLWDHMISAMALSSALASGCLRLQTPEL